MSSKLNQIFWVIVLFFLAGCGSHEEGKDLPDEIATQPTVDSGSAPWDDELEDQPGPPLAQNPDPESSHSELHPPAHSDQKPPSDPNSLPLRKPQQPDTSVPKFRYTQYCRLTSEGKVDTPDVIVVKEDSKTFSGLGGGCIERPIRHVWATFLDHQSMKDQKVDEYKPTFRRDKLSPTHIQANPITYFVFDIESVHWAYGFYPVRWTNQFFHSILKGNYFDPKKILIRGEKISGESRIELIQEEFQLEWISPYVTSLILSQNIKAPEVDREKVETTLRRILSNARNTQSDLKLLDTDPRSL